MVVITGASGLVGCSLARELLAQGRRVRALVHQNTRGLEGLDIELRQADVRDLDSLRRAFAGAEVVYHLAARISLAMDTWSEVEQVNVLGTRNVVEACLQCGVKRLVHFSSVHALEQEPLDTPLDEDHPPAVSSSHPPYVRSKALGEREARQGVGRGLQVVILIPTAIIGPYDYYPSYFGKALLSLVRGRIPALVDGGYDWVDVRDVVQGAIRAEHRAENGCSYLLSGHWRSVRQVANLAAEITRTRPPRLTVPLGLAEFVAPLMGMLANLYGSQPIYTRVSLEALRSNPQVSHARASRNLEYQPRSFEDTITDTLHWFAGNGFLDLSPDIFNSRPAQDRP